jgi:hypothetical protein
MSFAFYFKLKKRRIGRLKIDLRVPKMAVSFQWWWPKKLCLKRKNCLKPIKSSPPGAQVEARTASNVYSSKSLDSYDLFI